MFSRPAICTRIVSRFSSPSSWKMTMARPGQLSLLLHFRVLPLFRFCTQPLLLRFRSVQERRPPSSRSLPERATKHGWSSAIGIGIIRWRRSSGPSMAEDRGMV
jgi:hypothetical protein